MEIIWYGLIAVMLATYVVLDGFDFGAGILHLFVARNDQERRTVLASIGPVWDGNEVWLLATGGLIVLAFPRAYAAGFSGFYLPLMMVLWLLIMRGLSIEFRSHERHPLWRSLWDGAFFVSSSMMAIVLGAALGNLIRGVPLDATGYFSGPLFTNFQTGRNPGVLDWYTVSVGVLTLLILAQHGALYLVWKTSGEVQRRSRVAAGLIWPAMLAIGLVVTIVTVKLQPAIFQSLSHRIWTWPVIALVPICLVGMIVAFRRGMELPAFLASAGYITCLLAATAAGAFPLILISTISPTYSVTAYNAISGHVGLQSALVWWTLAIILAVAYFVHLFRSFRGKVDVEAEGGYGH
jgi:cytochrome bd ubiquinol oxidase subunit II